MHKHEEYTPEVRSTASKWSYRPNIVCTRLACGPHNPDFVQSHCQSIALPLGVALECDLEASGGYGRSCLVRGPPRMCCAIVCCAAALTCAGVPKIEMSHGFATSRLELIALVSCIQV
eukprot:3476342-Amphidinium_carterae.2